MMETFAVVMAGGRGERFWPLSRARQPKHIMPLPDGTTLLRRTVERLSPLFSLDRILIVTQRAHRESVIEQLPLLPIENVLDEPEGRDTGPCIALASAFLHWRSPESRFVALPADMFVEDVIKYQRTLKAALEAANDGGLICLGTRATRPATGYGYIHRGAPILSLDGLTLYEVRAFKEKPTRETATQYVASGEYLWNLGTFAWRTEEILAALELYAPTLYAGAKPLLSAFGTSRMEPILDQTYASFPRISIDYAVLEKSREVRVIEAPFEWDDIGSWEAYGHHFTGLTKRFVNVDAESCLAVSSDPDHVIAALGVRDLVIIHTSDATFVCPKDRAQDVKGVIKAIQDRGLSELL